MISNKYIEYNMINSIPILYPYNLPYLNLRYAPRYTIADAERLLHCFDTNKKIVTIQKTNFRFIRIPIDISFKTLNNDIKALYYYIMVDNTVDFEGLDYKNINKVLRWLRSVDNHYVLVTTPVLYYKHIYYSIANDNEMNIIEHNANETMDDTTILINLIQKNCYTICDSLNILIALFQKKYINKQQFIGLIQIHKKIKNFCYTSAVWLYLIHHHRIFCAYDFPILCLSTTPHLIDSNILMHYDMLRSNNHKLYLQTTHNNNTLFTTHISLSYPHTNLDYLKLVLGNVPDKLWFNTSNLSLCLYSKNSLAVNDFFALFAVFAHKKCMWQFWCENKTILLDNLVKSYNENSLLLFDTLCPLFRLYIYGYEGIYIRKSRIRQIWLELLHHIPITSNMLSQLIVTYLIEIPYVFLMDVFKNENVNFTMQHIMNLDGIVKKQSIYHILASRINSDSLYYFHKNVLKKRIIIILTCIYKKFGLFKNQYMSSSSYRQGIIIMNYLENNRHYLL